MSGQNGKSEVGRSPTKDDRKENIPKRIFQDRKSYQVENVKQRKDGWKMLKKISED